MKKRLTNNLGLKVLAFLSAFMLWFIVVNIDDPVTTKNYNNIPVSVINEEVLAENSQTYQITDGTQNVTVTVRANRSVLNRIDSEEISAVADMKELTLQTQVPLQVVINGHEGDYVEAYTTPRNLQVRLEEEETKRFPVVPATKGTVRDGYALGDVKAVPENVSIRGPQSVIERISRVEASVSVSGLSANVVLPSELKLYDENNEVIDQSLLTNNLGTDGVAVSVQILGTKRVPLTLDTSEVKAAEGYSVADITYEPREIRVAGTDEALAQIQEIDIPAQALELSGLTEREEQIVNVADYLPDTVKLTDENAGSVVVTVVVEKDGTKTYDVSLGAIVVEGLSSKLSMKYETVDVLEIRVRGAAEALAGFAAEEHVSISLKEYTQPGTYTVPVKIELPDGCALERDVSVNVILEKKQEQ